MIKYIVMSSDHDSKVQFQTQMYNQDVSNSGVNIMVTWESYIM